MIHPFYVVFIYNLVYSKFPKSLWKGMHMLCVMREKLNFWRKKILSFLGILISKPTYSRRLDCPSILCCLYTQFSIIKNFLEHMQSYALMLAKVWKIGFFKQFTDIWDFSYLNHKFLWCFYGQSIVCCLYTQFGAFKISRDLMEGYALVMRHAWKMDF